MKKLYFLDEEEKQRILTIHENATKKQYLNEELPGTENSVTLGELDKAISDPAKKGERIKNISRIVCSLNGDKITAKGSQFNGTSWVDYVTKFNITSAEEAQAKKLCSTGGDERLYNIAKMACSVDASGKIVAPNSKQNGVMFTDYIRMYKLTGEEVAKAKQLCGKLGNKPASTQSSGKVASKGKSNVASIAPRIQDIQKQLGIQNGTGTLDVASLQAMLSKLNGGEQTARPQVEPLQPMTPAGVIQQPQQIGMNSDQLNAAIKQLQANANRPI